MGGAGGEVKRVSCIRDRQRRETLVFSFHYVGSFGGGRRERGRRRRKKMSLSERESLEVAPGAPVPSADTQLTNMGALKNGAVEA